MLKVKRKKVTIPSETLQAIFDQAIVSYDQFLEYNPKIESNNMDKSDQ